MVKVQELFKEQAALLEQGKSFVSNYKRSPKDRLRDIGHIKGRIDSLLKTWQRFSSNDLVIRSNASEEERDDDYFSEVYDKMADLYYEYIGVLNTVYDQLTSTPTPNPHYELGNNSEHLSNIANQPTASVRPEFKLPQIVIPKFSGDYQSWPSFFDLFKSLVHERENLPTVHKMHYLKSCLVGEAEQLVRHLTTTGDNYSIAWSMLCKRYQNTRALVNNNLKFLFSQPHIQNDASAPIRRLVDSVNECLAALDNLKVQTKNWDPIIVYFLVERLPLETRQLWEQTQGSNTSLPELTTLIEFLDSRCRSLEALSTAKVPKNTPTQTSTLHAMTFKCPVCQGPHAIKRCFKFRPMKPKARFQVVSTHGLCYNCLAQTHTLVNCPITQSCHICQKRHNILIHTAPTINTQPKGTVSTPTNTRKASGSHSDPVSAPDSHKNDEPASQVNTLFSGQETKGLLATAMVKLFSKNGEPHVIRAVVDPGSEASFVTTRVVNLLGLKPYKKITQTIGIGKVPTAISKGAIGLTISPKSSNGSPIELQANVLSSLTSLMPPRKLLTSNWTHLKGLDLADPSFGHPGRIDMILGSPIYGRIIQDGVIKGEPDQPVAQNTQLGWIILGELPSKDIGSNSLSTYNLSLLSPPEQDFTSSHVSSLDRWKLIQKLKQDFWKVWSQEYLTRLQQRPKWLKHFKNVRIGDLVLLKDERLPCGNWGLGRIIRTYPGKDDLVRVVDVRTKSGEIKRPITKLCLLPINPEEHPRVVDNKNL